METVLLAAFTAVESAHAFSAFCPSIFTIKSLANQTPDGKAQIREGYFFGTVFSFALGFIVSLLVKSWLPLCFALATSAFMIFVYEWGLKG